MKKKIILILFSLGILSSTAQKENITIIAVGDIMMGTSFPNKHYLPAENVNPFAKVNTTFAAADILFGNLEGTLTDTGKNAKHCKDPSKCYSFKMPTKLAKYLNTAGFNVMSIANNHIGDFGKIGIENTKKTLEENGIAYAGVYSKPYTTFIKDSIKYGFAAFAPNKDCIKIHDITKAKEIVSKLEATCDIVIVSFHGGAEGSKHTHVTRETETFYGENRGNVYKFAHAVIDAGADIVLGHGPHVSRAIEVYKNRFITYSLGNFCTYKRFNLTNIKGFAPIIKVEMDKNGNFISGKIISAKQRDAVYPYLDENQAAFKEIKKLTLTDFPENKLQFKDDGSFYLK
ncbi:MAG: CapA family protein [Flavobacteriaceae bacterium]|nr:CapA family protein [Flavobacteriaceae bacterium]